MKEFTQEELLEIVTVQKEIITVYEKENERLKHVLDLAESATEIIKGVADKGADERKLLSNRVRVLERLIMSQSGKREKLELRLVQLETKNENFWTRLKNLI